MKHVAREVFCGLVAATLLLTTGGALGAPKTVAELTFQYQASATKQMPDGGQLFARCEYLGSGDGAASGALQGSIGWDLYEDQGRDDLHPTQFRGYLERNGVRHPFQIIGVFTPEAGEPVRRWKLTGTIVFDDEALFPARHAPVSGYVETGAWRHRYTVWADEAG